MPLWQSGGGGAGGSQAACAPTARTYASVVAGKGEARPEGASRLSMVKGASRAAAPTAVERFDARAPVDAEADLESLVREEARVRERSNMLAARLRAARERAQAGRASCSGPLGPEEPGDGFDSVHGHESGGEPERVFCAKDAQKTREPHVPLKRGDVGAAQGGGAGKCASGGPQEGPGPKLSEKAPARRAAPGGSSSAPPAREGEKVASRRCGRLRKASAVDVGGAGGGARVRGHPPFLRRLPQGAASRDLRGRHQRVTPKGSFLRCARAWRGLQLGRAAGRGVRTRRMTPARSEGGRGRRRQLRARLRSSWPSMLRR